jgi:hypothetical protein
MDNPSPGWLCYFAMSPDDAIVRNSSDESRKRGTAIARPLAAKRPPLIRRVKMSHGPLRGTPSCKTGPRTWASGSWRHRCSASHGSYYGFTSIGEDWAAVLVSCGKSLTNECVEHTHGGRRLQIYWNACSDRPFILHFGKPVSCRSMYSDGVQVSSLAIGKRAHVDTVNGCANSRAARSSRFALYSCTYPRSSTNRIQASYPRGEQTKRHPAGRFRVRTSAESAHALPVHIRSLDSASFKVLFFIVPRFLEPLDGRQRHRFTSRRMAQ